MAGAPLHHAQVQLRFVRALQAALGDAVLHQRQAFLGLTLNQGASASFMLLLIVLAMTVVFFWLLERKR